MDAKTALSSEAQTAMVLSMDKKVEILYKQVKTLTDKVASVQENKVDKEAVTALVATLTEENKQLSEEYKALKASEAINTPLPDDKDEEDECLQRDE